jgi:hypothetical protein
MFVGNQLQEFEQDYEQGRTAAEYEEEYEGEESLSPEITINQPISSIRNSTIEPEEIDEQEEIDKLVKAATTITGSTHAGTTSSSIGRGDSCGKYVKI